MAVSYQIKNYIGLSEKTRVQLLGICDIIEKNIKKDMTLDKAIEESLKKYNPAVCEKIKKNVIFSIK